MDVTRYKYENGCDYVSSVAETMILQTNGSLSLCVTIDAQSMKEGHYIRLDKSATPS